MSSCSRVRAPFLLAGLMFAPEVMAQGKEFPVFISFFGPDIPARPYFERWSEVQGQAAAQEMLDWAVERQGLYVASPVGPRAETQPQSPAPGYAGIRAIFVSQKVLSTLVADVTNRFPGLTETQAQCIWFDMAVATLVHEDCHATNNPGELWQVCEEAQAFQCEKDFWDDLQADDPKYQPGGPLNGPWGVLRQDLCNIIAALRFFCNMLPLSEGCDNQ